VAGAANIAILLAAAVLITPPSPAQSTPGAGLTLDRIRAMGRIRLGYRTDARPFTFKDDAGQAAGYSAGLCVVMADAVKSQPGLGSATVEWVPVTAADRYLALQQGRIDVLCGGESITLTRRAQASFSTGIFPAGIGALVRSDAPVRLRDVLAGHDQPYRPVWRGSVTQALQARPFAAVQGTTAEAWLTARIRDLQVIADISRVSGFDAGIQAVLDRKADALFGERALLLDAVKRDRAAGDLLVIDRLFTTESLGVALPRGDEEFRLLIDRALNRIYLSGEINTLYGKWFGEPDEPALTFFRWNTVPESH
jgi:ABC-type amino acid transport substrate-binding protein